MTTDQAIAIAFPFLTTAIIWATAVVIVKPWRRKKGKPEGLPISEAEERLIRELKAGAVFAGLERPGDPLATEAGRHVRIDSDRALEEVERIIRAVRAREAVTKP
jgi:hypothetical protein